MKILQRFIQILLTMCLGLLVSVQAVTTRDSAGTGWQWLSPLSPHKLARLALMCGCVAGADQSNPCQLDLAPSDTVNTQTEANLPAATCFPETCGSPLSFTSELPWTDAPGNLVEACPQDSEPLEPETDADKPPSVVATTVTFPPQDFVVEMWELIEKGKQDERVERLGGTTGAKKIRYNEKWFVLKPNIYPLTSEHIRNEYAADRIYEMYGIPVPRGELYDVGGDNVVKLTEFLEGAVSLRTWERKNPEEVIGEMYAQIQKGYVVDALLNGYDVVGYEKDNIMIRDGTAYRIDNGGSMGFRATGGRQPALRWNADIATWKKNSLSDDNRKTSWGHRRRGPHLRNFYSVMNSLTDDEWQSQVDAFDVKPLEAFIEGNTSLFANDDVAILKERVHNLLSMSTLF